MLHGSYNMILDFVALIMTAFAIKGMDDYLDNELDSIDGKKNLCSLLGRGVFPYAVIMLTFGMSLNPRLSGSLFSASYLLGMFKDKDQILPLGLTVLHESLIVFALSLILFKPVEMLTSLMIIFVVQIIDDLIDAGSDMRVGHGNLVRLLGRTEAILVGIIMLFIVCMIDMPKSTLVLAAAALSMISLKIMIKLWGREDLQDGV